MADPLTKPHPVIDPGTAPYWSALLEGRLILKSCKSCGRAHFYPRELCPHCFSDDLTWVEATGQGEIYSYTVCHRPAGPAFADDTPYVVAVVALEEGPRMMTRISGRRDGVRIGAPVKVRFERQDADLMLPFFELVEPSTAGEAN